MTIKRFIPISRGRANPINKFCSHIHVILADKSEQEAKQELTTKKSAAKTTVAKKPKTTVTKAKAVASKASNK